MSVRRSFVLNLIASGFLFGLNGADAFDAANGASPEPGLRQTVYGNAKATPGGASLGGESPALRFWASSPPSGTSTPPLIPHDFRHSFALGDALLKACEGSTDERVRSAALDFIEEKKRLEKVESLRTEALTGLCGLASARYNLLRGNNGLLEFFYEPCPTGGRFSDLRNTQAFFARVSESFGKERGLSGNPMLARVNFHSARLSEIENELKAMGYEMPEIPNEIEISVFLPEEPC